ncbi:MAG: restriction endonuclease [Acidithiobacillus sp.]
MTNETTDSAFHYPPELFNLLVDVIPLLNRSKNDVLLFFRGAGVPDTMSLDLVARLEKTPKEINKYDITRTILERLNTKGESALRERREVLRRVVEFANFDTCWPNDQLKAKGLISSIRDVVNQKDAFTRINNAREEEWRARIAETQRSSQEKITRDVKIESAKYELYSLFGSTMSAQARGKQLETALNNLFEAYGILVSKAFSLIGDSREGVVEQIDGVIELKGVLYFVEMKWYKDHVGKPEISEHLVRLFSRAEARGIFISATEYTEPAISVAREFLQHKVLVLVTLQEIVRLLEQHDDLSDFFVKKVQEAQISKNPYSRPY